VTPRHPDQQLTVLAAGDRYRFLATGDDTGGAYALWHATIPPGGGPPMHVHSREDERFDVLTGTVRFQVDGTTHDLQPGDSLFAPKGTPHAFRNITATGPDDQPDPVTPEAIELITRVCAEYGVTVVGPPIE
jgi:quercetin dioxygenase-like cupin family protein